ncbi:hypothetical protein [Cryptosporangium aurantiacum]|uniref:hypothetical protein n=1 Tax=Cryptosporangium aurantiacum TaxID=134849 RepID=UPI001C49D81D|nr:hypothetical protein [Cryptosporangium aurantiacum]
MSFPSPTSTTSKRPAPSWSATTTLAELLREAEEHHGAYEAVAPAAHHWSDWYSAYIVARAADRTPDEAIAEAGRHMEAALS